MTKLRNNRGETLVEVLASILIAALSVALLFSFTMTSSTMDKQAKAADEGHYDAIIAAESVSGTDYIDDWTVTITDSSSSKTPLTGQIGIKIYGDNGVFSYRG